jgi:hypothetical protein
VFDARPAVTFNYLEHRDFLAQGTYVGGNPPYGATIDYWIANGTADARVSIKDPAGKIVREMNGPGTPGLHRILWDLRYTSPPQPPRPEPSAGVDPSDPRPAESTLARLPGDFGGGGDPTGGEAGGPRQTVQGPEVLPGAYSVTIAADGGEHTARVIVQGDPRVEIADEDRNARFAMMWQIYEFQQRVHPLQQRFGEVSRQLRAITTAIAKEKQVADELKKAVDETARLVRDTQSSLGRALQQASGPGRDVQGSTSRPTAAQREQFERGAERTRELIARSEELFTKTMPAFAADFDRRAPPQLPRLQLNAK